MDTDHHHHHHHHHHYRDDVGRDDRPSPNPHRLTRSRTNRILGGVCGGLAEYFGWKAWHVRLVAVLGLVLSQPATIVAYVVGCFAMKPAPIGPPGAGRTAADEQFWRNVSTRPSETFSRLKHTFRGLEERIATMERAVTTEEYRLNRAFREMEDRPRGSGS